ncbi:MAG: hypothetical protein LBR11_12160 [Deltaproteobacteria bacterium]|nr:hypothetical protein [Deltaproteobacteria bacterium]
MRKSFLSIFIVPAMALVGMICSGQAEAGVVNSPQGQDSLASLVNAVISTQATLSYSGGSDAFQMIADRRGRNDRDRHDRYDNDRDRRPGPGVHKPSPKKPRPGVHKAGPKKPRPGVHKPGPKRPGPGVHKPGPKRPGHDRKGPAKGIRNGNDRRPDHGRDNDRNRDRDGRRR